MAKYKGKQSVREATPPRAISSISDILENMFATPPRTTNWVEWPTPLTMRTRKLGVDYLRSRIIDVMEQDVPLTPSVIRV